MQKTTFNEAQLELLRMMALIDTPEAVSDIRQALSDYFAKKAKEEIDKLWEKGELTEEKVDSFRHLHERTPYQADNGR
ncbi:MAG: dephospho-CoA kinase [Prevotella sp.]|nr:dephospho-CoA kinase [Prevotella sp.]